MYQPKKKNAYEFTKSENAASQQVPYRIGGHDAAILRRGRQPPVYATEVSAEEYLAYTTEETEKVEVYRLAEKLGGDIEAAIRQLAEKRRTKS